MEKKERLIQRYEDAKRACASLKESLEFTAHEEQLFLDPRFKKILRDSIIQRFEFTYDITWKYLKDYLENRGIVIQSPRSVFQECQSQGIVTKEEVEQLFDMIDARNLTTHLYSEAMAIKISERISDYYRMLNKLLTKTKP